MSNKPTSLPPIEETDKEGTFSEENALLELRGLILGHMESQLAQLQVRLDDSTVRAKEVGRILPESIIHRSSEDDGLSVALMPVVEQAVRFSIKTNLKVFADALFPVMGPAIRKAIAEALRGMMQSLNEAMEKSLSWQGIRWRLEAFRTKKSLSEIMLLHSIVYRVEQIFLIHRQTGLMLQHMVIEQIELQDADMVSGMLTAIRDFVADSFKVQEQDSLETIRVGELTVWIEQGPTAILAAVIRGNAPESLRTILQEALETVHLQYAEALESLQGDTDQFESAKPALEVCLRSQYKQDEKKLSPVLIGVAGGIVTALIVWIAFALHDHRRWTDLLTRLNAEEGIVVTSTEKQNGTYIVRGLRDELSIDPFILLQQAKMKPDKVSFHWTPYQAMSETIALRRLRRILRPPDTVTLKLQKGVLVAKGSAPHDWVIDARRLVQAMPGIETFQTDGLVELDLDVLQAFDSYVETLKHEKGIVVTSAEKRQGEYHISGLLDPLARNPLDILSATKLANAKVIFHWEPYQSLDPFLILERAKRLLDPPNTISLQVEDSCLVVRGSAPHRWIVELHRWIRTIPGAPCLRAKDLVDLELKELLTLKRDIEAQNILFLPNTPNPIQNQIETMERVAIDIQKAMELSNQLGIPIHVTVLGHTDRTGTEERNRRLSQRRGQRVLDFLVLRGIPSHQVSVESIGSTQPLLNEDREQDRERNRRVSFQVILAQENPKD
jgi:OOP family OmpA-OmpF porin